MDTYLWIIIACIFTVLSYLYNLLSKKTKIPSILFLIITGIVFKYIVEGYAAIEFNEEFMQVVEFLGIVGLIMIVLEAAMDLKLSRDKLQVITKSFLMALVVLVLTSLTIGLIIKLIEGEDFINSLVYAIPLSVISSAVLIPSVSHMTGNRKEFLIYESTFSDIIGIMFFNYVVLEQGRIFSLKGISMIVLTVVISVTLAYILVYFFTKIRTEIKLFLMLAILVLLYSISKQFHLSALLIIFIFGLAINNPLLFFFKRLAKLLDMEKVNVVKKDFKLITGEVAFLLRTFFFISFGMFIDLRVMLNIDVILMGSLIIIAIFIVRYINFRVFTGRDVFPQVFLAPRGLITILLFYSIPEMYLIDDFSEGVLLFVILGTALIMMIALMGQPGAKAGGVKEEDIKLEAEALNTHHIENGATE